MKILHNQLKEIPVKEAASENHVGVEFQFIGSDSQNSEDFVDLYPQLLQNISDIVKVKDITRNTCGAKAIFLSKELAFSDAKIAVIQKWLPHQQLETMCAKMDGEILGDNNAVIGSSYHAFCTASVMNSNQEKIFFAIDQQTIRAAPLIQIILAKSEDELATLLGERYGCMQVDLLKTSDQFQGYLPESPVEKTLITRSPKPITPQEEKPFVWRAKYEPISTQPTFVQTLSEERVKKTEQEKNSGNSL